VDRLALLDATARPDDEAMKAIRRGAIGRLRAGGLDELVETSFELLVHPSHVDDLALLDVQREMLQATGAEAAVRETEAYMNRQDARPGLAAIAVPTLVLVGDGDRRTPPERAQELAAGIAGAELVVVERCGHISTLEQPEAVTRALVAWKAS
jgi:pimeloyl-ACP methyl ester carboxylesterase